MCDVDRFSFFPAQRAIRSDSLAHRARKPVLMISKGPTGRPFAVMDHGLESNCRPVGPSTSCFVFASRADGPGYLNCWPFGPKQKKLQRHGVVSGQVLGNISPHHNKRIVRPSCVARGVAFRWASSRLIQILLRLSFGCLW